MVSHTQKCPPEWLLRPKAESEVCQPSPRTGAQLSSSILVIPLTQDELEKTMEGGRKKEKEKEGKRGKKRPERRLTGQASVEQRGILEEVF